MLLDSLHQAMPCLGSMVAGADVPAVCLQALAQEVACYLGLELSSIKIKRFADGEIYVQVQVCTNQQTSGTGGIDCWQFLKKTEEIARLPCGAAKRHDACLSCLNSLPKLNPATADRDLPKVPRIFDEVR